MCFLVKRGSEFMIEKLVDFFLSLRDILSGLINFVVGTVEDLVYVVTLCGRFVLKIPSYFSWLPTGVVALIVTVFAIVVIYKILGREG